MYNLSQPTIIENVSRIIVIGDVHGDIKRLLKCMINAKVFTKDLKWIADPQDTIVVQMGDQVDSANRGLVNEWEEIPDYEVLLLMDRLDNIAKINGGRVLSLIGNHEIMNIFGQLNYVSPNSLKYLNEIDRIKQFQPGNRFAKILAKRNIILKINNLLFCHAALLPEHLYMFDNNIHKVNEIARKKLNNEVLTEEEDRLFYYVAINDEGILWNRIYTQEEESVDRNINEVLKITDCSHIFIGHNTVPHATSKFNNKIIFTDAGLSRAYGLSKIEYIDINNDNIHIIRLSEDYD